MLWFGGLIVNCEVLNSYELNLRRMKEKRIKNKICTRDGTMFRVGVLSFKSLQCQTAKGCTTMLILKPKMVDGFLWDNKM